MKKPLECSQCGATDFEDISAERVRCAFCGSLFQLPGIDSKLIISKGARVVFGKGSDVEIHGGVEVQPGAEVDFQGKVEIRRGNQKQEFNLTPTDQENQKA